MLGGTVVDPEARFLRGGLGEVGIRQGQGLDGSVGWGRAGVGPETLGRRALKRVAGA